MAKQSIGEFLATLRKANGYTQQEVADRLGISNRTLSGWECNNVLPDILLLPVLAELYGVTVDELLAGERKESTDLSLSGKSETKILKSKIARFSMQGMILLGIIIAGIALVAVCVLTEATKVSWVGFPWWRVLLFVGIVPVIVCLTIFFAFWKGAELSVDDTCEYYGTYCIILRKKMANCLYAVAAASMLATVFVVINSFVTDTYRIGRGVFACVAFGVLAFASFLTAWLLYRHALSKWGSENARHAIIRDRRYFWAVGFWGAIPLTLSVILAIVLSCVHLEDVTTVYESNNLEEFVEHVESFRCFDKDIHFPLSQLAKTAKLGDEFDLGDGFVAVYHGYSFTITNEQIMLLGGNNDQMEIAPFMMIAPRLIFVDENNSFSFFNVAYYDYDERAAEGSVDGLWKKCEKYSFERVGDGMAYVHVITRDYSTIGYLVASGVIALDLFACLSLCVLRRNKYVVKL